MTLLPDFINNIARRVKSYSAMHSQIDPTLKNHPMNNSYPIFKNCFTKILATLFFLNLITNYTSAQTATGLNFDGINDMVTVPDNAAYNLGTGNFTVEAWVKAFNPQTNSSPSIFYRRTASSGISIWLNSLGQLSFNISGAYSQFGNADIDDNTCHHIAVVRSAVNAVSVYVDGILKGTSNFSYGSISSTVGITIGNNSAYKGWIHEVRFWNVARTQTEIQNAKNIFLTGSETGLIGYWRMNEGSGQAINDLSAINNDGYLGTVNTTDTSDPLFVSNSCLCPNPVIASTGGAVCTGQNPTLSTTLIAGYTYQWKLNGTNIAGATSSTHIANIAGSYTCVATAFGCSGTSNVINLISGASPATVSPGGPITFCSGNSITLSANTGTLLSYQWKLNGSNIPGATNFSYIVTSSGNYTCVVTNNCGSSTSNTVMVTVNQTPTATVSAGGPTTFCQPGSVLLTASPGAGYTYQWRKDFNNIPGATAQTYSATTSGNYYVVVTLGSCAATSAAQLVTVEQPLSPTITQSGITFCPSSAIGLQTMYVAGASYQWFDDGNAIPNNNSSEILAGHDADYTVNVTNTCGTFPSPPYTNSYLPIVVISPSSSLTICATGGSVNLSVDNPWVSGFPTFQWYKDGVVISGATSSNYVAIAGGAYRCNVSENFGCWPPGPSIFSNQLTVIAIAGVQPTVSISAAGNTTFCTPGSVTLNSTVNTSVSYQWKLNGANIPGATSASYVASSTGTYYCAVTNSCGSSMSTGIAVNALSASVSISSSTTNICSGSSVWLSATFQNSTSYQWKKNGVNISGAVGYNYGASTAGSYTCAITNICGSSTSNAIVMSVVSLPTATISGTQTICSGSTAIISVSFTGTGPWYGWIYNGSFYTNFNTSLNPYNHTFSPTTTTTYTLYSSFHDSNCNGSVSGSATVTVAGVPPSAAITPAGSLTFCSGGSVLLNANTGAGLTYQWKKDATNISGATLSNYTATSAGTYTVVVTNGCGSSTSAGVVVTVNSNPNATITAAGSTTFCAGGSVTLNAVVAANRAYQWKKSGVNIAGATSASYVANASGTYKVTVTNTVTGCTKTSPTGIVVTKVALPSAVITPQGPTTFCAGQSVVLAANTGAGLTYKWKRNGNYISLATNANYTATTAGNYRVEVTNSSGCSKTSASVTVTVPCREGENISEDEFNVIVSPNPSSGDFVFEMQNAATQKFSIDIYDMSGKLILSETIHNSTFIIHNLQLVPGIYSAVITAGEIKKAVRIVKVG